MAKGYDDPDPISALGSFPVAGVVLREKELRNRTCLLRRVPLGLYCNGILQRDPETRARIQAPLPRITDRY